MMLQVVADNLHPFDKRTKEAFQLNEKALLSYLEVLERKKIGFIDVNLGHIKRDKEKIVSFFIKHIEKTSNFQIIIDSTDREVIEIALNVVRKKPIINGFSMEEKKLKELLPLARKYDCKIVGLVMADSFIPKSLDEKFYLAERMINEAEKNGIRKSQLILDPIIAPLGWSDGVEHNKANLEFIRLLPQVFGEEIETICGLSNLTTNAARGTKRGILQSNFLSMLYGAGIDMVLVDVFDEELSKTINFIMTLEENRIFSFNDFLS